MASVFALLGKTNITNGYPYANTTEFYDVTSGSNGTCSSSAPYLCKAGVGYDGPTGWGTPNGAALAGASAPPPSEDAGTAPKDSGTTTPKDAGGAPPKDSGTTAPKDSGTTTEPDAGGGTTSGTCTHSICSGGAKLVATCSPCAKEICSEDSYCCKHKWDSVCIGEVTSICGETCE
jgi:hypothetical protein